MAKPAKKKWPFEFLGRCQNCLDNAYLQSDCPWRNDPDCLVKRVRNHYGSPEAALSSSDSKR